MAKEKRSLFSKIFGDKTSPKVIQKLELLNGYNPVFNTWSGNPYSSSLARSCIDAIARHGAKISPKHIRKKGDTTETLNSNLQYLIDSQPNELMTAYDFYYKVISLLYKDNNAFIFIKKDEFDNVVGLYPIYANRVEFLEAGENVFLRFDFMNKRSVVPYSEVIHLRRFYCEEELLGSGNAPINDSLSTLQTIRDGVVNAIQFTSKIRGMLKTGVMLDEEDKTEMVNAFYNNFIKDNATGIAPVDANLEFTPLKIDPKTVDAEQMKDFKDEVLYYYGISEKILKGEYTEDEWSAFYEGVLEPLAVSLSQNFTAKVLTAGARSFGNKIIFGTQRLQYASNRTKALLIGLDNVLTTNEKREILNLPSIEGGDVILQSLNYVNSKIADEYQLGKEGENGQK